MSGCGTKYSGVEMILPDLIIPSRIARNWIYSGIDSPEHCRDRTYFHQYPHEISYNYNQRGFRDQEWPENVADLQNAIWCVGDSFTAGIGQPLEHTWPYVLSQNLARRTINVSMDGASNDWIYRRTQDICQAVNPKTIIIMWSYMHRRESSDTNQSDDLRRIYYNGSSNEEDIRHWKNYYEKIKNADRYIIQSAIPDFSPIDDIISKTHSELYRHWQAIKASDWPPCPKNLDELENLPEVIKIELKTLHDCYGTMRSAVTKSSDLEKILLDDVIYIRKRLDWARDYHHFDILTSQWFVDQITPLIE
jgi:hypothetical protein